MTSNQVDEYAFSVFVLVAESVVESTKYKLHASSNNFNQ